jgi:hypothetical protein
MLPRSKDTCLFRTTWPGNWSLDRKAAIFKCLHENDPFKLHAYIKFDTVDPRPWAIFTVLQACALPPNKP